MFTSGMGLPKVPAPFIPTPIRVVGEALGIARVNHRDVVVDLGCGDGRVPIIAAKRFGAKGVCVELDDSLCSLALANVKLNSVDHMVDVVRADMFAFDVRRASVVYAYHYGSILRMLSEKLDVELRRGSRVITLDFRLESWVPLLVKGVIDEGGLPRTIYLYLVGVSNPSSWVLR